MDREINTQKLTGYNKSRGLNYISLHLKKYELLQDTYISPDLNMLQKAAVAADFIWCIARYGAGINDYFQYQFFNKKHSERKNFIVGRKWKHIIRVCNGQIKQAAFDDKSIFNELYSDFLGRDWIDTDKCSVDEFSRFINKHPESMAKIKEGSGGNGIFIYKYDGKSHAADEFAAMQKKHVILEEIIKQHSELAEFNPSSVNTLRLVTITDSGVVHLMNAVLRMGNGTGCTDNFHHYGLAALVDTGTGKVYTPGVDKKNQAYAVHPGSGKEIVGFHIPYWDKILDTVSKAAVINENVRYVGWDVAIKEDGTICIIEGNCASDPDITQIPDQKGKWRVYKKALDELKK